MQSEGKGSKNSTEKVSSQDLFKRTIDTIFRWWQKRICYDYKIYLFLALRVRLELAFPPSFFVTPLLQRVLKGGKIFCRHLEERG